MNKPPPTAATAYIDGDEQTGFQRGAKMAVDGGVQASGNRPEPIAERKEETYMGKDQPIYKGRRYKFFDAAENHPSIPKSAQTQFSREAIPAPAESGGDQSKVAGLNKNISQVP